MRLAKLLVVCLLCGCSSETRMGRIESIQRISTITVTYKSETGVNEYTRTFRTNDKESQDVKVGDIIKFNSYGFVGRVQSER